MKSIGSLSRSILLSLAALGLAFSWPEPVNASLRKCTVPPGSTARSDDGPPFLMVDGVVVGDIEANRGADGSFWYATPGGRVTVSTGQIEFIVITCVEHEVEGERVARGTVSIGTKDGIEGMLRRYLADLAALQEGYRRANGEYGDALAFPSFRQTRHPVHTEMSVAQGGWTATMAATTASTRACRIAIGAATAPGAVSGEVECFDRAKEATNTVGTR